jgi:hypothetical protein
MAKLATDISTSVFATTPQFHDTPVETCFTYERKDGKKVDMAIVHHTQRNGVQISPALLIGVMRIKNNPNCATSEFVDLSIEEARILRDLLNKPEVQAILAKV